MALLHGLVYCGECGHKMVVQYKGSVRYICNYLRQQYGVPVCQNIPAPAVDAQVLDAFFQALSSAELDAYAQAVAARQAAAEKIDKAQQQQVERLRYEAALAERQYKRVDPDNRLVAAELEKRWEMALRALKQAEDNYTRQQREWERPPTLPAELEAAFQAIGQRLPQLWEQDVLSREQKKALLRCLIDKVVVHRKIPEQVHTRIVWRGGDVTTMEIPVPVGSFAELSRAEEMTSIILERSRQGESDAAIADYLTSLGHRSPMQPDRALPSTVRTVRLRHGVMQVRSQSHPRRVPGMLTISQIAQTLDLTLHWIYDRIHNERIQVTKDEETGLYLFPDEPETIEMFKQLKDGTLKKLRFSRGYQDE